MDDEPAVRRSLARLLIERGVEALTAEDGAAALALLATTSVDVLLLDLTLPSTSSVDLIERLRAARPDVEIIVMAELADLDAVPGALQAGAFAFVNKPPILDEEVVNLVARAASMREIVKRARALEERALDHEKLGEIVGQSRLFRAALRVAFAAGSVSSPVLILGETGVGKELLARAIHRQSGRLSAGSPFLVIDCGAIPSELIEDELVRALEGEGTVLFKAVGELPLTTQARLVQALSSLARGKGTTTAAAGARVIAAATPDLRERVAEGRFREDLFYRLAALLIEIPPLRQRRDDIPLLAYHFVDKYAGAAASRGRASAKKISVEAQRELRERAWPGNVRELSSAIERAVLLARGDVIFPADLPAPSGATGPRAGPSPTNAELGELPYPDAKERVVDAFDSDYVERVLEGAGGNISEAARRAGMDRSNFRRLLLKVRGAKHKQSKKA